MNTLREHIILKFALVFLVAALVTPSIVKLSHAFANHEHEICTSETAHHFHKIDLDCGFYKFKLSKDYTYTIYKGNSFIIQNNTKYFVSQYSYISDFQKLPFALRAPPTLV